MDDKARKMAKKAQDSARTRESAAHRSENAAKQAMDTALRNLYKKHPELSGMVTFGDAYLPGNASQPQAKAKPQSTPDGQAKGVSTPDGQAKPDPMPVSVSVSVTVDSPAAHQHDFHYARLDNSIQQRFHNRFAMHSHQRLRRIQGNRHQT